MRRGNHSEPGPVRQIIVTRQPLPQRKAGFCNFFAGAPGGVADKHLRRSLPDRAGMGAQPDIVDPPCRIQPKRNRQRAAATARTCLARKRQCVSPGPGRQPGRRCQDRRCVKRGRAHRGHSSVAGLARWWRACTGGSSPELESLPVTASSAESAARPRIALTALLRRSATIDSNSSLAALRNG